MENRLRERVFSETKTREGFGAVALDVFRFQAENCATYRQYIDLLGVLPEQIARVEDIPYLPVEFFKTHLIYSAPKETLSEIVFTSSGTTGAATSSHIVADLSLYEESFVRGFEHFYGDASSWSIFALLPSYLERDGSSLVYMVEKLEAKNKTRGGFYMYDYDRLTEDLNRAAKEVSNGRVLLVGVAFALLDYADYLKQKNITLDLPAEAVVMETGGMKGKRREVSREDMHEVLCTAFGVSRIHSEYGMTELLSQAYSDGEGLFRCQPWMRVSVRDLQNPLRAAKEGQIKDAQSGGINIIDLANLWSCSFIAVQDRGVVYPDGSFRVLGRIEGAQLRGCNMLVE